jgi:hypothetical protein
VTAVTYRRKDAARRRSPVDTDVDIFPTGTAPPVAGIAGDAVSDGLDTAELLDIDMDQLAWPLAWVAHHRRPGFEHRELTEHQAAQNLAHDRNGHAELPVHSGAAADPRSRRSARQRCGSCGAGVPSCGHPLPPHRHSGSGTANGGRGWSTVRRLVPPASRSNPA